MTLINWLLSAQTAAGVAIVIGFYILSKVIDLFLEAIVGRKVLSPIKRGIVWRIQAFLTRMDPIKSSFEFTYTPHSPMRAVEIEKVLDESLDKVENRSGGRISVEKLGWTGSEGNFRATHPESKNDFELIANLQRDNSDLIENPDAEPSEQMVSSMHLSIEFSFAFAKLENELSNVGTLINILREILESETKGSIGPPKIVIQSLESNLTLEQWISEGEFDVSVHLKTDDDEMKKTQLEFLTDRVRIYPPYYDIDGEVIRYMKIIVMNYYLLGPTSNLREELTPSS